MPPSTLLKSDPKDGAFPPQTSSRGSASVTGWMYGFMFLPFFPIERVAPSVRSVCRYPACRRTLARRGDHALP